MTDDSILNWKIRNHRCAHIGGKNPATVVSQIGEIGERDGYCSFGKGEGKTSKKLQRGIHAGGIWGCWLVGQGQLLVGRKAPGIDKLVSWVTKFTPKL